MFFDNYISYFILFFVLNCIYFGYYRLEQTYKNNKYLPFYRHLLEFPKGYKYYMTNIDSISKSENLVQKMKSFLDKTKIPNNNIIVSLSGGVDSMVILSILLFLRYRYKYTLNIFTASIDYSQRRESANEIKFIKLFCRYYHVRNYSKKVENLKRKKARKKFEETSRNIRFDLYKKIMEEKGEAYVFLGHHKDDLNENIFNNLLRGRTLLDLEVMKEISKNNDVKLCRPFLNNFKKDIYDFAHRYNVPYFLDTTPKWSNRGKMRNEIFPLLDSVYGISWKNNLLKQGKDSTTFNNIFTNLMINPLIEKWKIEENNYNFELEERNNYDLIIWSEMLKKLMHLNGYNRLPNKTVFRIYETINSLTCDKKIKLKAKKGWIIFIEKKLNKIYLNIRK